LGGIRGVDDGVTGLLVTTTRRRRVVPDGWRVDLAAAGRSGRAAAMGGRRERAVREFSWGVAARPSKFTEV